MKIVKGVRVFEKRELIEKLSFAEEDADLVMMYQKKLPILLGTEDVDARVFWEQLGRPYTKYADWMKRKVLKQNWQENIDYFTRSITIDIANDGYKEVESHFFTIDMAKHVAMMENNENGKLVRNYFIKMEKALKDYEEWTIIREPQKESYKEMSKALDDIRKEQNKNPNKFVYSNEADMINVALTGYTAKQIKEIMDYDDKITRDHFTTRINHAIDLLQQFNIEEIYLGTDYHSRKSKIEKICQRKYRDVKEYISGLKLRNVI